MPEQSFQVRITPAIVPPGGTAAVSCARPQPQEAENAARVTATLLDQLGEVVAVSRLTAAENDFTGNISVPEWARDGAYELVIGDASSFEIVETLVVLAAGTSDRLVQIRAAEEVREEAVALAAEGQVAAAAQLHGRTAELLQASGWNQLAVEALLDEAALTRHFDPERSRALERSALVRFNEAGRHYRDAANYSDAAIYYRRALELAEQLGEIGEVANNESNLGEVLLYQRFNDPAQLEAARIHCEAALRQFNQWWLAPDRPASEVKIRKNLAAVCVVQGEYTRAAEQYEAAIARLMSASAADPRIAELTLRLQDIVAAADRGAPASFAMVVPERELSLTPASLVFRAVREAARGLEGRRRNMSFDDPPRILPAIAIEPAVLVTLLNRLFAHFIVLSAPLTTLSLAVYHERARAAHGVSFAFAWDRAQVPSLAPGVSETVEIARISETQAAVVAVGGTLAVASTDSALELKVWLPAG